MSRFLKWLLPLKRPVFAFEAMSEVRNRLVTAYEDIMKMPI